MVLGIWLGGRGGRRHNYENQRRTEYDFAGAVTLAHGQAKSFGAEEGGPPVIIDEVGIVAFGLVLRADKHPQEPSQGEFAL